MAILVYKTTVSNEHIVYNLKPYLDKLLSHSKWNFDLEDCDKILRVETKYPISQNIIDLLIEKGFLCEELEA